MSKPEANGAHAEELEFEQELLDAERSLHELKQRYAAVQEAEQAQPQLQKQLDHLQQQLKQRPTPALKAELQQIQDQLEQLDLVLESRLFTVKSFAQLFWRIVRFSGLGVLVGWFLAFAVLQSPQPERPPTTTSTPTRQP